MLIEDVVDESSDGEASGSESAALPESVVVPGGTQSVNPVVVLGGPGFDFAVVAPVVEVCGSASAAQVVVVKPVRSWKQESHGRWRGESSRSSSCSVDSAQNPLPAAHKRSTTTGEASASGRTVQSGSGSSRLPFAQPPAVAGGIAGGSLLALGLAALRAGLRTVEVVSIAADDLIMTSTVAVTDLIESGALAIGRALHGISDDVVWCYSWGVFGVKIVVVFEVVLQLRTCSRRMLTNGEASASGRTVQSGSGSETRTVVQLFWPVTR